MSKATLTIRVSKDIKQKVNEISKSMGTTISHLVENALQEFFNNYKSNTTLKQNDKARQQPTKKLINMIKKAEEEIKIKKYMDRLKV